MPTRFQAWQKRRRIDAGAQFLVAGPLLDPATVAEQMAKLELTADDPPLYVMVIPPFGPNWIDRMEQMGAVAATDDLKQQLADSTSDERRAIAWDAARRIADMAHDGGAAGAILMGLRFDTIIDEATMAWRTAPAVVDRTHRH
jgi:5,10-methylenetetrahydrofolate reductase